MKLAAALSFLILFSLGCNQQSGGNNAELARVGHISLTKAEAKKEIPEHIFEADSLSAYSDYRDDWIKRQIILQEAQRLNFSNRRDVQERIKRLKEEYILQAVQDFIIADMEDDISVSDQEARNYYQQNKDKFTLNERYVRYRHLVAANLTDAEDARQDLLAGVPWEEVAQQYSLYPELKIQEAERFWPVSIAGGDVEQLNLYLNIIGISEVSPIHKTGNEYHFVQLLEERPKGEHPDLDWLIEEIKEWLVMEKRKRAFNTYVKNLYLQGQANNEIETYNVLNNESKTVADTISSNNIPNEE